MDSSVNTLVRAHIVLTPFYFSLFGEGGAGVLREGVHIWVGSDEPGR